MMMLNGVFWRFRFKWLLPTVTCILILSFQSLSTKAQGNEDENYLKTLAVMEKQIYNGDCNPDATKTTIQFLLKTNENPEDYKHVSYTDRQSKKDEARVLSIMGEEDDEGCSLRLINWKKLRKFLIKQGFLENPGSVLFINDQGSTIHFNCNGKHEDKEGYGWSSYGWGNATKEDEDFFEAGKKAGNRFNYEYPTVDLYFRRTQCYKFADDNPPCTHLFYIITRPRPEILNFPLQAYEGQNQSIYCALSSKTTNRLPQPPYNISWILPETAVNKRFSKGFGCKPTNMHNSEGDPVKAMQYYFNVNSTNIMLMNKNETIKENAINDAENENLNRSKTSLYGVQVIYRDQKGKTFNLKPLSYGNSSTIYAMETESTLEITESKGKIHNGYYECVFVDGNGVPSTPSVESFNIHTRFKGRAKFRVRALYTLYVPAIICGIIVVIMIAINFLCPEKMEHDDGTVYTKEELVSPEEETRRVLIMASQKQGPPAAGSTTTNRSKAKLKDNQPV